MAAAKLTDKQKRFCEEYLIDSNAKQAAIRTGYSKKTADVQGVRLLKNVNVKKYIESRKNKLADNLEITAERTLQEIADIAYMKEPDRFFLNAKVKCLEMLSKHLGIFEADNSQKKTELNMNFTLGEGHANPYVPGNRLVENKN